MKDDTDIREGSNHENIILMRKGENSFSNILTNEPIKEAAKEPGGQKVPEFEGKNFCGTKISNIRRLQK